VILRPLHVITIIVIFGCISLQHSNTSF